MAEGISDSVVDPEAPMANRVWAAMTQADRDALRPELRRQHLMKGDVLIHAGDQVPNVHFPTTADIANVIRLSDGRSGMATTVGRDSVTALAAFLAREPIGWEVEVETAGISWCLPASALRRQADASPELMQLLLRLTHINQIEAAQNTICNALHSVRARTARSLLCLQDRTGRDSFEMRQEDMSRLLSVQRTTVNAAWSSLVAAGGISARRGKVHIRDRVVLKTHVCPCYEAMAARAVD